MQFRFFHIPAIDPAAGTEALNSFLKQHRILTVEREFVSDGQNSFWSVCVRYAVDHADETKPTKKRTIDYREVLDEHDFAVYAKLRTLRKELSEKEGVPAYALLTNEQMAKAVTTRVSSTSDLAKISGVGEGKVKKYGDAFVKVLRDAFSDAPSSKEKSLFDETQ